MTAGIIGEDYIERNDEIEFQKIKIESNVYVKFLIKTLKQ